MYFVKTFKNKLVIHKTLLSERKVSHENSIKISNILLGIIMCLGEVTFVN